MTDDSWKAAQSAIIADGPFDGEVYDARCEIRGGIPQGLMTVHGHVPLTDARLTGS